jgi:hypothetical protein
LFVGKILILAGLFENERKNIRRGFIVRALCEEPQTRFAFAINNFVISLAAGADASVPPCFPQIMALRFSFSLARLCKYCERMRASEERQEERRVVREILPLNQSCANG